MKIRLLEKLDYLYQLERHNVQESIDLILKHERKILNLQDKISSRKENLHLIEKKYLKQKLLWKEKIISKMKRDCKTGSVEFLGTEDEVKYHKIVEERFKTMTIQDKQREKRYSTQKSGARSRTTSSYGNLPNEN